MATLIVVRRATVPLRGKVAGWPDAAPTLQCLPVSLSGMWGKGIQRLRKSALRQGWGKRASGNPRLGADSLPRRLDGVRVVKSGRLELVWGAECRVGRLVAAPMPGYGERCLESLVGGRLLRCLA